MRIDLSKWHRWFAWHPVQVDPGVWIWLGTVERRWSETFCGEGFIYREVA